MAELSGRDLVDPDGELVSEDAIDLYAEAGRVAEVSPTPGRWRSRRQAIEESQRKADLQESSSVDLSSRPSYARADFDKALEAPSAVDSVRLGHRPEPAGRRGRVGQLDDPAVPLDDNSEAIAAEFRSPSGGATRPGASRPQTGPAAPQEVVPAREEREPARKTGDLIRGGVLGLLLGAGSVLAAYFGGALPTAARPPRRWRRRSSITSVEVARLKQDTDVARKEAADAKADTARQVAEAKKAGEDDNRQLADAKAASDADARRLTQEAQKARTD